MPQMAPIWWFSLFSMFLLTYCIFMTMMYFYNIYQLKPKTGKTSMLTKNINWKW